MGAIRYTTHLTLSDSSVGQGFSAHYERGIPSTGSGDDESVCGDRLDLRLQRTPLLIDGNGVIQNSATVNAFPRMEHQKEIGETFQRHQAFAS